MGLRQAPVPLERRAWHQQTQHARIEFVTHIMQELNWSPFYLQSRIEEIKFLYLIFNGKNIFYKPFYASSRLDSSIKKKKKKSLLICTIRCALLGAGGCGAQSQHGPSPCLGPVAEPSPCLGASAWGRREEDWGSCPSYVGAPGPVRVLGEGTRVPAHCISVPIGFHPHLTPPARPHRAITLENTLVILSTVAPDAGRYYVQAVNDKNGDNKTSQPITLTVASECRGHRPLSPAPPAPPGSSPSLICSKSLRRLRLLLT